MYKYSNKEVTLVKHVPNILSIFRICLVPVFVLAYFLDPRDIKVYAIIIYAFAALTDLLDGYIARKFDAQSNLGNVLDPLGDKLMTFAAIICLTITTPILFWAVFIFFVKEALLGIGGLVIHRVAKADIPPANYLGKASTVVFFIVCGALMIFTTLPDNVVLILMSLAIGLTLVALGRYIVSYSSVMKSRGNTEELSGEN